ncbi:hypothetical protein [Thioalkalivibrio thiocyanodenitrificans]|uniref:hypothetical protein n=1 Tax=Thioalkalivibrio thiocyanodenitrificans TaxID=243063 RepID=UPI0003812D1C|nr:hypothetical protein [Thioalkalivibrio thiocyanodenitrificans]
MNKNQAAYCQADSDIGHLLVQIDTFYQDLPTAIKNAFDRLGSNLERGGHCDLEEGQAPDGCVLDQDRAQDCVYARNLESKHQCEYWRPIVPVLPK